MSAPTKSVTMNAAKLLLALAPPPKVYVFVDVTGKAYDLASDPHTHQQLIGVSSTLWYETRKLCLLSQGEDLARRVQPTMVKGYSLELPFKSPVVPMMSDEDFLYPIHTVIRLSPFNH